MTVFQYDPKQVTLTLILLQDSSKAGNKGTNFVLSGFSDDDFIEVERDEDAFTKKTGVDGQTTRAKNNVRTGHIISRIMQSSASNDDLSKLAVSDEDSMTGLCSLVCKDLSGRSVFTSDSAWVKKFPKQSYKKDVAAWEWTIDCGELVIKSGGN